MPKEAFLSHQEVVNLLQESPGAIYTGELGRMHFAIARGRLHWGTFQEKDGELVPGTVGVFLTSIGQAKSVAWGYAQARECTSRVFDKIKLNR